MTNLTLNHVVLLNVSSLLDKSPNILDLLNKVAYKVRDKWEMMGLALGMELNQLNSFSKHADPIKCYTEVFSAWITLTWVTFIP